MKPLAIATVALKRFVRDRSNLFFVFIMPLGIIILIGAQFGGGQTPRMGIHLPADAGAIGEAIVAELETIEAIEVVRRDSAETLRADVALGTVALGLDIPAGLSDRLAAGETAQIAIVGPAGVAIAPYVAMINQAIAGASETTAAIRFATARGATPAAATAAVAAVAPTIPTIAIETTTEGESLFEGLESGFQLGATSQLILFMFVTGLTGAAALIQARRYGVTLRMMGTPTPASQIILGEGLGRLGVVLVQGLYIIVVTAIVFQVEWGSLLAAALILLTFGAVATGAAMLFGSLFSNDQQAAGIGVMAGLGLSALGGAMVPYEIFPATMQTIAHFTPQYWALDAFAEVQRRGGGVLDILPQLGVLAAFAAVLLGLATLRMRSTLGRSVA
ncbi:MAG: ABC transporter permease [Bauldia sp.]|nr:ABC transporter permease [Bauldia sp.]